jgi:Flp pilus assembly pilin Flp
MGQVGRGVARWRAEERGAQLVEFALVLPLLLLLILAIADFGFMFQRYEVLTNVQARVTAYVSSGRVPTTGTNPIVLVENVSIPMSGGRPPISAKRVTVTYTYTFQFLNALSAFFGSRAAVPLSAVSEMRVEVGS